MRINISELFLFLFRRKKEKQIFKAFTFEKCRGKGGRGETLIQLRVIKGKSIFVSPPCISSVLLLVFRRELNMLIFFNLKREEEFSRFSTFNLSQGMLNARVHKSRKGETSERNSIFFALQVFSQRSIFYRASHSYLDTEAEIQFLLFLKTQAQPIGILEVANIPSSLWQCT